VAQNFELFSKIQDQNEKIKKPIAVDVHSETYPMIPFSCTSNLAGGYLYDAGDKKRQCINWRVSETASLKI
jgi:hypothetical protein